MGIDVVLTVAGVARAGYASQWGAESVLQQIAEAQHKPMVAVEGEEVALDQLANFPQGTQIQLLEKTVSDIETGQDLVDVAAAAAAWRAGDVRRIEESANRAIESLPPAARMAMIGLMNRGRNPSMVAHIESFLESNKVYFVAVGMFHIVGSDGIAEALRRAGYDVIQKSPSSSSMRQ